MHRMKVNVFLLSFKCVLSHNASGVLVPIVRQIVGADAVSSADGASSPAKGDCAKSIGITIATKNNDFRVIQCIDKLMLPP